MKEISEEVTSMFMEGKEKEFHNLIAEMIQSLDNAQKTVKHAYKIPICAEEDYNLFITNLEKLITEGLKTEPDKSLKLIYNFIMIIIPKLS